MENKIEIRCGLDKGTCLEKDCTLYYMNCVYLEKEINGKWVEQYTARFAEGDKNERN